MKHASIALVVLAVGAMLIMPPSIGNIIFLGGALLWASRCHKRR